MRLSLADGSALTLSPDHFVPAVPAGRAPAWRNHAMMRAREVQRGMHLFVAAAPAAGGAAAAGAAAAAVGSAVVGVEVVEERGLYNPYTLGGMVVVDSVVASSHSAWVLDGLMDAAGLTHCIPATYQALFAPIRVLYRVLGPARAAAASAAVVPFIQEWLHPGTAGSIAITAAALLCASKLRAAVL